jgi:Phytanoyl-CoA dioxygenase (PhyH)
MRLFRRGRAREGSVAVVERPIVERPTEVADDFPGTTDELIAEIERLTDANRASRDRETERRLVQLRHFAGVRVLIEKGARPEHPEPDFDSLPSAEVLPEIAAADVTPELLRAGILRDGCLLVRGLVERDAALRFAEQIDRAYAEREKAADGQQPAEGYYEEFRAVPPFEIADGARLWVREGGGLLAPDSPLLTFEMLELFRDAGLPELVGAYLGERPLISLQKTTLRKAEPQVPGAWHQDGAFMGEVRALNLWLSLSRCGDESPGLDIVPRRLDHIVATATDDAVLDYQVSQAKAEEAAGDKPIVRPIFEPGDALLFDELFLHQTGSDPSMPKPRFAVESWFFGGSAFPGEYGPVAV